MSFDLMYTCTCMSRQKATVEGLFHVCVNAAFSYVDPLPRYTLQLADLIRPVPDRWIKLLTGSRMAQEERFMLWCVFCALYMPVGVFYLLCGVRNRNKLIKLVLKCIPILMLFFFVLLYVLPPSIKASNEDAAHEITTFRIQAFLWGLAFSCIGDACLVVPPLAPFGVLSFAVSICIYIFMFFTSPESLLGLDVWVVLLTIPILLGIIYLLRILITHETSKRIGPALLLLVCTYFCILSLMVWMSILRLKTHGDVASSFGMLGAVLFFISDTCIAASAIYGGNMILFRGRVLIMTTYYAAQLFIALSL